MIDLRRNKVSVFLRDLWILFDAHLPGVDVLEALQFRATGARARIENIRAWTW
jgi:hypothetical protein